MLEHRGVVESMSSIEVKAQLPARKLDEFRMDPKARADYQNKFCGPDGGSFSGNVLDAVEDLVRE